MDSKVGRSSPPFSRRPPRYASKIAMAAVCFLGVAPHHCASKIAMAAGCFLGVAPPRCASKIAIAVICLLGVAPLGSCRRLDNPASAVTSSWSAELDRLPAQTAEARTPSSFPASVSEHYPTEPLLVEAAGTGSDIRPAVELVLTFEPPEILIESEGLLLEWQRWSFGVFQGQAFRVRVELPGLSRVAGAPEVADFSTFLPDDDGPWAVINGGFYDQNGSAMGLVISDGLELSPYRRGGGSGIFQVEPDRPRIIHRSAWSPGPTQALQSIDRIVDEGENLVRRRMARAAARSAVVVGSRYLWLVVLAGDASIVETADGITLSHTSWSGLPLWAFADYLVATTDAIAALNLDGGVSTQLAVQAGGRAFRVRGERKTINALIVRPSRTARDPAGNR
ncbi:MAG: phosphodiester glycosidase family protein [Bradymonadales bacterium]|nr:phosphodiester glycosidase family protein [Bradymonadales bacterium]